MCNRYKKIHWIEVEVGNKTTVEQHGSLPSGAADQGMGEINSSLDASPRTWISSWKGCSSPVMCELDNITH